MEAAVVLELTPPAEPDPLRYPLFVSTLLGFGANEARRRYVDRITFVARCTHGLPTLILPVPLPSRSSSAKPSPNGTLSAHNKRKTLVVDDPCMVVGPSLCDISFPAMDSLSAQIHSRSSRQSQTLNSQDQGQQKTVKWTGTFLA